jgi:hypothetical protein
LLDGIPLIDAHVHAARLPTLKLEWREWAQNFGKDVPLDDLYDEAGTVIPARFDEYMAQKAWTWRSCSASTARSPPVSSP